MTGKGIGIGLAPARWLLLLLAAMSVAGMLTAACDGAAIAGVDHPVGRAGSYAVGNA